MIQFGSMISPMLSESLFSLGFSLGFYAIFHATFRRPNDICRAFVLIYFSLIESFRGRLLVEEFSSLRLHVISC